MADFDQEAMAFQQAYANIYNELVKPDKVFVGTQYFRRRWVPLLGPALAWIIVALRQHCYWRKSTGEKRDWCLITQEELAAEVGVSPATLKRLLKHPHAGKFIVKIKHRYRYDARLGKRIRQKSMYQIRMDDPLVPEDETRLKTLLAEKLSGLNIDPETGQIDLLQALDRLAQPAPDHQSRNLSDHSAPEPGPPLEASVETLAAQLGLLLTGSNDEAMNALNGATKSQRAAASAPPFHNAVAIPAAALPEFALGMDQVLVPWDSGWLAVPIAEVVKHDLRVSGGALANACGTECFYSVSHALGEGPEDWLPDEKARLERQQRLAQTLGERYLRLGAFSLEEALQRYFTPQLAAQLLAGKSPAERDQIAAWVAYTRRASGLTNAAGFLRSRIEGGEQPPALK